jgi:glyoxylase I family protein
MIKLNGQAPLFQVYDMQVSLHFYCDILGFKLISSDKDKPPYGWVLFRMNNVELMMEPVYPPDKRPAATDPVRHKHHHDTTIYFGCPDVDAAYLHLRSHNIPVNEPRVASYGMKQLYFTDPDGYGLCFQWPATKETFDAWKKWYGRDFEVDDK